MTEPITITPTREPAVIRQLDSPWMKAKEAAIYFRVSLEEVRRAGREFEKTNGRSGLKVFRRNRHSTIRVHHDDVVHWMAGNPPTRGTRRFAST